MSEPKFTPGEWELVEDRVYGKAVLEVESEASNRWIAYVLNEDIDNGKENAYLIAAAPDMYAALKEAFSLRCPHSWCRTNSGQVNHGYCSTHQRIYNALTKAEGGQK